MASINGILNDVSKKLLKLFSAYLPAIVWAAVIYIFSAQSSLPGFDVVFYDYVFKKFSHMFVYAVFYFLLFRAVNYENDTVKKNWWLPFVFTFGYAVLDEFHQVFTPRRHPSPLDVGFDMIGASVVFLRQYRYI